MAALPFHLLDCLITCTWRPGGSEKDNVLALNSCLENVHYKCINPGSISGLWLGSLHESQLIYT